MAATKAQKTPKGRKNYGRNKGRGDAGETAVMRMLRAEGYIVSTAPEHPHGWADITATKGRETRRIQVKNITSRRFLTAAAALRRIRGRPYNIRRIPPGGEVWVFDADGRRYVFRSGGR